ncbi:Polyisoprenoid-binding protein YceI [Tenacibaculum sp. MAR_2009_124]|uniref:YceI family protein n=1 Tax=Tenacibaculum sp. MAR_2009_124 TaxID=1250059 RepID=UPI000896745C|nr:YceI family protein [Tenacibaculum sp. MAR_2009_124]SEC42165.1 Polyisoprenoid-binding protein YceI [Tenacibaculum sp. MAR_2009_124]
MRKISVTLICFLSVIYGLRAQEKLPVNLKKSKIQWIGEYTFYFGGHEGTINLIEGYFIKNNKKITGGKFTIDMNTIKSTDIENKKARNNLDEHLKDSDFFDVKKYPKAYLSIDKIEYFENNTARVEASFTIKGITKPVKFNADLNYEKQTLKTKFKIDRRRWNVNYTSKMKDGAISDAIGFIVEIGL